MLRPLRSARALGPVRCPIGTCWTRAAVRSYPLFLLVGCGLRRRSWWLPRSYVGFEPRSATSTLGVGQSPDQPLDLAVPPLVAEDVDGRIGRCDGPSCAAQPTTPVRPA